MHKESGTTQSTDVRSTASTQSAEKSGAGSIKALVQRHMVCWDRATLISSDGRHENVGFMAAFDHSFVPVTGKDGSVGYSKVVFAADCQSGKNALGAAGAGLYYYFTPDISLLVGPTLFNDKALNGSWRISTQLAINLPKLNFGRLMGNRGH